MSTLNTNGFSTLLDVAKRLDPNGKIARIVESLTVDCPLLEDMPWVEANGPDGHLITTRTSLPSLTWRKYNQGILPTKSSTAQFSEVCGMLDGTSKVDVKLAQRRACRDRMLNQTSTWLSQDELVGVKCRWKRGCLATHLVTLACLWVA